MTLTLAPVVKDVAARIVMVWAALFLTFLPPSMAQAADIKFPELTGRVVDDAHMLSPDQAADLSTKLKALEDKNGRQLVVVTLPSLQGQDIEDFGYQLGRKWGIGQKGQNNGVLFIIAPAEHKVRIEVGYGLEPVLTDALSSLILQDHVLPRFRAGDMAGGVMEGAEALTEQLGLDDATAHARVLAAVPTQRVSHRASNPLGGLIALVVIFFVISSIFRRGGGGGWFWPLVILSSLSRGGRGGDWGGGGGGFGGGDDSFGGGGGSFGGGGSSGSW